MPLHIVSHVELQVADTDLTVIELKHRIQLRLRTPAAMQSLIFRGEELEDDHHLSDYNIQVDSTLLLVLRGDVVGDDESDDDDDEEEDKEENTEQAENQFQRLSLFGAFAVDGGYAVDDNTLLAGNVVNFWETHLSSRPFTVHVLRTDTETVATTIQVELSDTLHYLKREISRVLGYDMESQLLHVGDGVALGNRIVIQDVPEIVSQCSIYLTVLPGYWFNTD